ncbi:hypothetical protein EVAR_69020_1 [Eumeta japonica]|uniref:Uncharacterized protein n=1 Tax=Eumeta variegata TaxID=151549 RepID=A0A4C2A703_EUMVA|nr:hypothetical protein EVAR_69020_1 [Eumeta japonica]
MRSKEKTLMQYPRRLVAKLFYVPLHNIYEVSPSIRLPFANPTTNDERNRKEGALKEMDPALYTLDQCRSRTANDKVWDKELKVLSKA